MHKILAILPAKNEEKYIEYTLKSLEKQSTKPDILLLVDDGSTDNTPQIMLKYVKRNPWMKYIRLRETRKRNVGARVGQLLIIAVKYAEQKLIPEWNILFKFDADTIYEHRYIEKILQAMKHDEKLGVTSGITVNEPVNPSTARGTGIAIRRKVWKAVKPKPILGWDSYIMLKAKMLGWKVKTVPEAKMYLLRPTGASEKNICYGKYKQGYASRILGYTVIMAIARSLRLAFIYKRLSIIPYYLSGYIKGGMHEEIVEKKLRQFTRILQYKRILEIIKSFKL